MTDPHHARLMASNAKLLQTGKYSDLTIKCGVREWQLHRSIVCEGSKFFAAACDGTFLESESNQVNLQDDDPTVFEHLLSYLYTLDYDDGSRPEEHEGSSNLQINRRASVSDSVEIDAITPFPEQSQEEEKSSLTINVQVYAMADKYDMQELKILAKEKFSMSARDWPLPDFPSVVREALSSTPESDRGLRDIIRQILADHVEDIYSINDVTSTGPFATATKTIGENWRNALRDEGCFLYGLLGSVVDNKAYEYARLDLAKVKLEDEVLTLQNTIMQLRREQASCETELDAVKDRGARLTQEIYTRDHCRHCSTDFQMSYEVASYDNWYYQGTLRCKKCRTKHPF